MIKPVKQVINNDIIRIFIEKKSPNELAIKLISAFVYRAIKALLFQINYIQNASACSWRESQYPSRRTITLEE